MKNKVEDERKTKPKKKKTRKQQGQCSIFFFFFPLFVSLACFFVCWFVTDNRKQQQLYKKSPSFRAMSSSSSPASLSPRSPSSIPFNNKGRLPSVRFLPPQEGRATGGCFVPLSPPSNSSRLESAGSSFIDITTSSRFTKNAASTATASSSSYDPFAPSNLSFLAGNASPRGGTEGVQFLQPTNSFREEEDRKKQARDEAEKRRQTTVVRMFPLASALPRMPFERTEAVEKPHYVSFSPRKVRSGWKTAETMSEERALGRTLSTMLSAARRLSSGSSQQHNLHRMEQAIEPPSPRSQALRVSNSFILEESVKATSPITITTPIFSSSTRGGGMQQIEQKDSASPDQKTIFRTRSLYCTGEEFAAERKSATNKVIDSSSSSLSQQQVQQQRQPQQWTESPAISSENRARVHQRRSIIAASNIGDIIEWDQKSLQEELFTDDDREAIADSVHQYMHDLLECAVKILPPPPDVSENNQKGTSELSQLTLRKLLPTLKRKLLGTGGSGSDQTCAIDNNNNNNNSNCSNSSGRTINSSSNTTTTQKRQQQYDLMGKLAPEWLVNGKTLHPYAQEHLDTLLVRSILSLPDCPHIRHILFLHVKFTPARMAVLLHKGFGSSRASIASISNSTLWHQNTSTLENIREHHARDHMHIHDSSIPMIDDDDDDVSQDDTRDPLQRAMDEGIIPLLTSPPSHQNPHASNELTTNVTTNRQQRSLTVAAPAITPTNACNICSLCLAFCQVESGGAQVLFEWLTFAPSAVSLTTLDLSHNNLENRIVPQLLRAIQRGSLKHLNLRGNPNLFVGTVGNLGSGTSASERGRTSFGSAPQTLSTVTPGLRLTKSVAHTTQGNTVAFLPVTPAVFLHNANDFLTTVELSLCGISADHVLPVVNAIPRYNFASLTLDNVELPTRAAAALLENLTQNTSLVHLSLKFIVACSSKLYQERLSHLLSRNLELFYDAHVFQPLMEQCGDVANTPKKSVLKAAQGAFLKLQPHFSTGTPMELLRLVRTSSLQRALQGELVPTTFVMRRTTSGTMKLKGRPTFFGAGDPHPPAGATLTKHESSTTHAKRSIALGFDLPSNRIARQLARDEDEDSEMTIIASELEREAHTSSALPPGYGAYYSNEPTKTLQQLQLNLMKKRDELAAALNLELQRREQVRNVVGAKETPSETSATSSASTSTTTAPSSAISSSSTSSSSLPTPNSARMTLNNMTRTSEKI